MSRHLLLQSVLGHLALLAKKYPKKAASPVAKAAKLFAQEYLRQGRQPARRQPTPRRPSQRKAA